MSEPVNESPEVARRRLELRGFNREQAQAIQQMASQMAQSQLQAAQNQMRRAAEASNNFASTVVALVSSAVGFVAAFAWNDAIQAWLNIYIKSGNAVQSKVVYALSATIFAVLVIGALGIINNRFLKNGKNLLDHP